MGYLSNFVVYLFAMMGVIMLALFVYKKFNVNSIGVKNNHTLRVEDALSISARKTLYVIKSGSERFLIAADMERTTLISKLEDGDVSEMPKQNDVEQRVQWCRQNSQKADLSQRGIRMQDNVAPISKPIMREIRSKLNF